MCRAIEAATRPPRLADLAKGVSLSSSRLHRVFTDLVGVTQWAYDAAIRAERFRLALEAASGVLDAPSGAWHGSVSNADREAARSLGLTPLSRSAGRGEVIEVAAAPFSLGFAGIAPHRAASVAQRQETLRRMFEPSSRGGIRPQGLPTSRA